MCLLQAGKGGQDQAPEAYRDIQQHLSVLWDLTGSPAFCASTQELRNTWQIWARGSCPCCRIHWLKRLHVPEQLPGMLNSQSLCWDLSTHSHFSRCLNAVFNRDALLNRWKSLGFTPAEDLAHRLSGIWLSQQCRIKLFKLPMECQRVHVFFFFFFLGKSPLCYYSDDQLGLLCFVIFSQSTNSLSYTIYGFITSS